ncbi:hypothetical protein [Caballeronia sp. 15715]|uniref:hypothetical protein n=1 Tax=unclassified Caballeronia TaxID=2646786 RepID=UPI0039E2BB60
MTKQGKTSHDAASATRQGPAQDGRELESKHPAQQKHDDGADVPLPHEADQSPESQQEDEPREVGEQAHEDLERGLQDTDRRGGAEYQERTQERTQTGSPTDQGRKRER